MRRFIYVSMMIAVLMCVSTPIFAQEWSAAQREILQVEETAWKYIVDGNAEAFLSCFHPDWVGWSYSSPYPLNKEEGSKYISYYLKTQKIIALDYRPLSVKIYGNVAIVHLYYNQIYKDAEGKERSESGRWTDIFMKEGDKWLLIGDHGGTTSSN